MDTNQAIQRQFGAAAAAYAVSRVHRGGPDLDAMLAEAGLESEHRVLDLGCGTGHTSLAFAARVREVVAIDLTEEMLEQGRRLAREREVSNVRFELGDATVLPFDDRSFDCVTSRLSAHHYLHPDAAVAEAARVLRPGGLLLLSDSLAPEEPVLDTFMNTFELLRDASHVRNHRVSEWHAMFATHGFASREVGTWPVRTFFDDWVERMATPATAVAQLRVMFAEASGAAREAFDIDRASGDFSIPIGVLVGRLGASALRPG